MKPVGIIANPASGKDIRRLVAYGSVFDNNEKTNIVKRLLMALDSLGVREVLYMPDYFHIVPRALEDVDLGLGARALEMPVTGSQEDTTAAAGMMAEAGAACIVTLGGDGTNRVAAKACGDTPLLPISTGTNNVFGYMVEGTLAGLAAGLVARGDVPTGQATFRAPRLELWSGDRFLDMALVDVVVSQEGFTASRAVWDVSTIQEIFLTRAEPWNIGFSSVGGRVCPMPQGSGRGLHIRLGPGGKKVQSPIAPGLIRWLDVASHEVFEPGRDISLARTPAMIALDGEREFSAEPEDRVSVRINLQGPLVVQVDRVLEAACDRFLFTQEVGQQGG